MYAPGVGAMSGSVFRKTWRFPSEAGNTIMLKLRLFMALSLQIRYKYKLIL